MTTEVRSPIPASAVQHAALDHEIRTACVRKELDKSQQKSEQLDAYRSELKTKVEAHMEALHKLDATKERTAQIKEEMLEKVNKHLSQLEKESYTHMAKKDEVVKIKDELLAKVQRHAEELEQMDAKSADLQKYKSELLARVEEHIEEVAHAEEKRILVRRLSVEMSSKVKEYQDHLAERARILAQLKGEISKELAQKFQPRNEYTDLMDRMQ